MTKEEDKTPEQGTEVPVTIDLLGAKPTEPVRTLSPTLWQELEAQAEIIPEEEVASWRAYQADAHQRTREREEAEEEERYQLQLSRFKCSCGSTSFRRLTQWNGRIGPGGKSNVVGYECSGCSTQFGDPDAYSVKAKEKKTT